MPSRAAQAHPGHQPDHRELTGFVARLDPVLFDYLSKDTLADSARLTIERIAAQARCTSAAPSMRRRQPDLDLPQCEALAAR